MTCEHGARRALCIQCHPVEDHPKLGHDDLIVSRIGHSGGLVVAAIIDGVRKSVVYYGFGERRARRAFLKEYR